MCSQRHQNAHQDLTHYSAMLFQINFYLHSETVQANNTVNLFQNKCRYQTIEANV
jgi:hypothetical protein